jgi:hypothetical protein
LIFTFSGTYADPRYEPLITLSLNVTLRSSSLNFFESDPEDAATAAADSSETDPVTNRM